MELGTQFNLLSFLTAHGWESKSENSINYIFLPPSKLKLPKDFKLYIPKEVSSFSETAYGDISKTISYLYNLNESSFRFLLSGSDITKLSAKEIEIKFKKIGNRLSTVKIFKGQSLLYPNAFAVVTFNEEEKYLFL
jgi:hypothetical protein